MECDNNLSINKEEIKNIIRDLLDSDEYWYSDEDEKPLDTEMTFDSLNSDFFQKKRNNNEEIVSITKKEILSLQEDGDYRMPVT